VAGFSDLGLVFWLCWYTSVEGLCLGWVLMLIPLSLLVWFAIVETVLVRFLFSLLPLLLGLFVSITDKT
jgi:hypothetical protein